MSRLFAIDPGKNTGIASFLGGRLTCADVISPELPWDFYAKDAVVVIEFPKIYPCGHPRPNDLMKLAAIAGQFIERCRDAAHIELVYPRDWKGSIDGDVFCKRIEAALTAEERDLVSKVREPIRHNAIDAIGLGKWAMRQPFYKRFRNAPVVTNSVIDGPCGIRLRRTP